MIPLPAPVPSKIIFQPETKIEIKQTPADYVVVDGDTLTSVSERFSLDLSRLWAKNDQLNDPDILPIGTVLKLPTKDEQLPTRPLPSKVEVSPQPILKTSGGSLNLYDYHSCTWWAKEKRPDLPNNLGNAYSWVASARAQGIPTGNVPKAGAVGQQGGHVVYIESVNSDGTVYLSEMNYDWRGGFRYRTANASDFTYIY